MAYKKFPVEEYLYPGNAACGGCGAMLAFRHVMKVLGEKTILVIPAGCTSVIQGPFPTSAIKVPVLNMGFAAAAAAASGVEAGLEVRGESGVSVVVWAGDGGTADIGFQALSGAAERNENILYICYDNEAYMNTGVQRSSTTPPGARTTTTPGGKKDNKKNIPLIMVIHKIPYVATACASYPNDLLEKVSKAKGIRGTKYLHILAPCPPGWDFDESKVVALGKLAVETGYWPLYEVENGVLRFTGPSEALKDPSKRRKIQDFLSVQNRFGELGEEGVTAIQEALEELWRDLSRYEEG